MTNTHQSLCSARDQRQLIIELEGNDPQPATIKALSPNSFTLVFLGVPGAVYSTLYLLRSHPFSQKNMVLN